MENENLVKSRHRMKSLKSLNLSKEQKAKRIKKMEACKSYKVGDLVTLVLNELAPEGYTSDKDIEQIRIHLSTYFVAAESYDEIRKINNNLSERILLLNVWIKMGKFSDTVRFVPFIAEFFNPNSKYSFGFNHTAHWRIETGKPLSS